MKRILLIIMTSFLKQSRGLLKDLGEVLNDTNKIDFLLDDLGVQLEPLIIGGRPTQMIRVPSAVLFFNDMNFCGGVILSTKIVITAAHCLTFADNLHNMRIFANSRYIFDKAADVHFVWNYIVHENYGQPVEFSNDVALLIIIDKFIYKGSVKPAQLVTDRMWMNESASENFEVTGWGIINHLGANPRSGIQSVDLHFVPTRRCEPMLESVMSSDMFCLWGGEGANTGACQGDSGGGVLWRGKLVGIVSHGSICGKTPGVYSNVFYHRRWIDRTVYRLYEKYCSHQKHDG